MKFARSAIVLLVLAAGLRICLFLSNPPVNSFDNHFEPIRLIMETGRIPDKDACFQCYHPPVFYGVSAFIGKMALGLGAEPARLPKILQSLSCLYGILQLVFIFLILIKLPLSDFSRTAALAIVCFLPRHIYISAMHSNDTLAYLLVSVCVYLLLCAIERRLPVFLLCLISAAITAAVFTKYTALAVAPAVLVTLILTAFRPPAVPVKKMLVSLVIVFALPLLCLGWYMKVNLDRYNQILPWNTAMMDPGSTQPRAERLDLCSFKLPAMVKKTVIHPEFAGSFWTILYGRMWFDIEPKFLYFTDKGDAWWQDYYSWLRGEKPFPDVPMRFSRLTRFFSAGLFTAGLVPLFFLLAGCIRFVKVDGEWTRMLVFPVLLVFNLAGIIAMAVRSPVFSMIKAVYLLNSLPALAVLTASGIMFFESNRSFRRFLTVFSVFLCALAALHIAHIAASISQ